MSLTKDLSSQFITSLFHHPTSRDLRSHRTSYHYSKFHVDLKLISLDALSIQSGRSIKRNRSVQFFGSSANLVT